MRNTFAVLLTAAVLTAASALAFEPSAPSKSKPAAIDEIFVHQENISDPVANSKQRIQDRWRRYCPRGYFLQRYYIRIGNVWVVQYRCVRYYGRGPWGPAN